MAQAVSALLIIGGLACLFGGTSRRDSGTNVRFCGCGMSSGGGRSCNTDLRTVRGRMAASHARPSRNGRSSPPDWLQHVAHPDSTNVAILDDPEDEVFRNFISGAILLHESFHSENSQGGDAVPFPPLLPRPRATH